MLFTTLILHRIFSALRNQIAAVKFLNESWTWATTWLPEYRTELLRASVVIGLLILYIAYEISRERCKSEQSLKKVGSTRERQPRRGGGLQKKRKDSSGDEEDEEEQVKMTKTQIEFCKRLYKEWNGTVAGHWHSTELKKRMAEQPDLNMPVANVIRHFYTTKRKELVSNSTNELSNLSGDSKNGGNGGTTSQRRRRDSSSKNKPTTPASSSKLERKSKSSTRVAATPNSRTPPTKRNAAATTTENSAKKRPPLSPASPKHKKSVSPVSPDIITPAQKRRTSVSSTTSGRKRPSTTMTRSAVKARRKSSSQQSTDSAANALKIAKADAAQRLREQAEESARAIQSAKKRKKHV